MKSSEDPAGLNIQTLPNPVITQCVRLIGAAATPLASRNYTALQAGVLDGWNMIRRRSRQQVLRDREYYARTQHNFSSWRTYSAT